MKVKITILLLLLCCSATLRAQQPAASAPAYKIAIFDSEMMTDERMGVKKLVAAYNTIEAEIKPRKDEITALQTKYEALVKDIRDTQATASQTVLAKKSDEAESLKSDIQRKQSRISPDRSMPISRKRSVPMRNSSDTTLFSTRQKCRAC